MLKKLSFEGLNDKFKLISNIDQKNIAKDEKYFEYKKRLEHEIRIIIAKYKFFFRKYS